MAVQRIKAEYIDTAGSTDGQVLSANSTKVGWKTLEGVNTSSTYVWTNTHTYSSAIYLNNDIQLRFKTVNPSAYSYFVNQSDDNFVFYSSNTTYGARPVWAIYANSVTSNLNIFTNLQLSSGLVANSVLGTAGQVLTSTGSGVYWGTSSGGGGTFDSSASYTWTGVQTFNANVTFNSGLFGSFAPRVNTATSTATLSWNSDSYDQYQLTALAANSTISADSGTPLNGRKIIFRFKDDGTARTLTWTTGSSKSFRTIGTSLPTTTVISKTLYVGAIYNSSDSRWDVIAVAQEI